MSKLCNVCGSKITTNMNFCPQCDQDANKNRKKQAWGKFFILIIPALFIAKLANAKYGFEITFSSIVLIAILAALYERISKKRSWHSIFWGKEKD